MNQVIKFDRVDFKALVDTNNSNSSLNFKSKIVDELNNTFTDDQKKLCIANLYMYLNYHPTTDYPIDLENVWKLIGFSHKKNAKRTLENNFIKDEDYKITVFHKEHGQFTSETISLPREQNKFETSFAAPYGEAKNDQENRGGSNKETIMLNVDTFKNLCMITKTEKAKEIRAYYVKLENIFNKLIKEEMEENKKLLREKEKQLENQKKETEEKEKQLENQKKETTEKENFIKLLTTKPDTESFCRNPGYIYIIKDTSKELYPIHVIVYIY